MEVSSATIQEIEESKEKENLRKLEAIFFVSGRYLSMQDLVSLSDLNPIILKELIATRAAIPITIEETNKNSLLKLYFASLNASFQIQYFFSWPLLFL